jgi:hypothetical protein
LPLQKKQELPMRRRARPQPVRNKLDLDDPRQVRLLKKRLQLSEQELHGIVGKLGNSISAISKEAAAQRASRVPEALDVPPAAVIASATSVEATAEPALNEVPS